MHLVNLNSVTSKDINGHRDPSTAVANGDTTGKQSEAKEEQTTESTSRIGI